MGRLTDLANKYGTDKGDAVENAHCYTYEYEKRLSVNVNRLLEIGVFRGSSAKMWREYYPHAQVHVVDLFKDPEAIDPAELDALNIMTYIGDQKNVEFLSSLPQYFDLIVEDGSHNSADQIISFKELFMSHLIAKGIYVVEDTHACKEEFYRTGMAKTYGQTIAGMFDAYLAMVKAEKDYRTKAISAAVDGNETDLIEPPTPIIENPYFTKEEAAQLVSMIDKVEFACDKKLIFIYKK
jgi:spermidine synthase